VTQSVTSDLAGALEGRFPAPVAAILQGFAGASASLRDLLELAPLRDALGKTGEVNVQGEATAKLDDMANAIFVEALKLPGVAWLVSEEEPEPVAVGDGPYTCCFDPLDGSSNIGVSPVGSILGVYQDVPGFSPETPFTGRKLVAAAFVVYGLPTMMILASAERADGFVFDPRDRSWQRTAPELQVPGAQYSSINWMYRDRWSDRVRNGVDAASDGLRGRYSGSMVEDILRVLMSGGVFLYPEDDSSPRGKLRMLYEICPISFIMEVAGGAATTGEQPTLDVPVTNQHQRSPVVVGSREAVLRYQEAYTAEA
jgi:fructose-1,6-bisphosphatase I